MERGGRMQQRGALIQRSRLRGNLHSRDRRPIDPNRNPYARRPPVGVRWQDNRRDNLIFAGCHAPQSPVFEPHATEYSTDTYGNVHHVPSRVICGNGEAYRLSLGKHDSARSGFQACYRKGQPRFLLRRRRPADERADQDTPR